MSQAEDDDLTQYEQVIQRLEEIVRLLEGGRTPLAQSLELYREAKSLSERANRLLERAEASLSVETATERLGGE